MHLCASDAATAHAFLAALPRAAQGVGLLLLPGDLFDAWIGDDLPPGDDDARIALRLADTLAGIAAAGTGVWLGRGNRDFLLGEAYAARCGARLLPEEAVFDIAGEPVLVMHGDALCTADTDYQRFRAQVREPAWQAAFLARPRAERAEVARGLRAGSREATRVKAQAIMDVDDEAVRAAIARHGVASLVHGHTHRPATHVLEGGATRRVLPDWDAAAGRGGFLLRDASGWRALDAHGR